MRKFNYYNLFLVIVAIASALVFLVLVVAIFTRQAEINEPQSLIPGEATEEDVKKVLGEPASKKSEGNRVFLYYNTQSEDYKDSFVVEKEKVKFSIENVFGPERGTLEDYVEKYGKPEFIIYDAEDEVLEWNIFLEEGLGIATFNNSGVAKILYFEPQTKENLLEEIVPAAGLSLSRPQHEPED